MMARWIVWVKSFFEKAENNSFLKLFLFMHAFLHSFLIASYKLVLDAMLSTIIIVKAAAIPAIYFHYESKHKLLRCACYSRAKYFNFFKTKLRALDNLVICLSICLLVERLAFGAVWRTYTVLNSFPSQGFIFCKEWLYNSS